MAQRSAPNRLPQGRDAAAELPPRAFVLPAAGSLAETRSVLPAWNRQVTKRSARTVLAAPHPWARTVGGRGEGKGSFM